MINLSQCSTMPFRHKAGDTFKLSISFSYDVDDVDFSLVIRDKAGAIVKQYDNAEWALVGTRKKTLQKTPVQFDLTKGEYNLKLIHSFTGGVVWTRFDSPLTVF